jgi:hypothetical protein
VVNFTSRPIYLRERDLFLTVSRLGGHQGPASTGEEYLAPHGASISGPRVAILSYLSPQLVCTATNYTKTCTIICAIALNTTNSLFPSKNDATLLASRRTRQSSTRHYNVPYNVTFTYINWKTRIVRHSSLSLILLMKISQPLSVRRYVKKCAAGLLNRFHTRSGNLQQKVKVKQPCYRPGCGPKGDRDTVHTSKTSVLEGGERSASRPSRTLPPGKTRYPLYRKLGGSQGRSGQAENLVPTGIRSLDRPARSQSLYRLRYPARKFTVPAPNLDKPRTQVRDTAASVERQ